MKIATNTATKSAPFAESDAALIMGCPTKAVRQRFVALGYVKVCGRCGGSGRYSYNQMDGDRCFGCSGSSSSSSLGFSSGLITSRLVGGIGGRGHLLARCPRPPQLQHILFTFQSVIHVAPESYHT